MGANQQRGLLISVLILFLVSVSSAQSDDIGLGKTAEMVEMLQTALGCTGSLNECLRGPPGPRGATGTSGEIGPPGPSGPPGPRIKQLRKTIQKITKSFITRQSGAVSANDSTDSKFIGFKVLMNYFQYPSPLVQIFPRGIEMSDYLDDSEKGLFNDGGHFNITSGRFTVPENGTYHFDMLAHLTSFATGSQNSGITTSICVNRKCALDGTLVHISWDRTAPFTQTLSGLMRLKKGDYVSVVIINTTFSRLDIDRLILSGYKIA